MSVLSAKNKRFKALTKSEKRVEIAKDVIKWIKAKKVKVRSGKYIKLPGRVSEEDEETSVEKIFQKQTCQVCALGACFVGMVDLGNDINTGGLFQKDLTGANIDDWVMRDYLRKIFSNKELFKIETAFELQVVVEEISDTDVEKYRVSAIAFGKMYEREDQRLIAIMKNIIHNKGEFKP